MSRDRAEEAILGDENINGLFLIRESEKRLNCYALSMKYWNTQNDWHCKHYLIVKKGNMFAIRGAPE